jgi:hypothetical protein
MASPGKVLLHSGIRDNRERGTIAEFLQDKIRPGSSLSFVSAYFTAGAFAWLMP